MDYFELTADGAGVTARVSWQETVRENDNASDLAVTVELMSSAWYGVTYWLDGSAAGTVLDPAVHYSYIGAKNSYYPIEGGQTPFMLSVEHSPDGTGTAEISLSFRGATRSGGAASGWRIEGSRTVELTPIVRASTVGATDADIGAVSMIAVGRKNSEYSHSLSYSFGGLSGYIAADGTVSQTKQVCTATAIPFKIPEEFYYQIPDSPTGVCTVTCITECDGQQIGVPAAAAFTVTAPKERCSPIITPWVEDVNERTVALTGDSAVLVRFCSEAQCTAQIQGQMGASVLSCTADGAQVPARFPEVQRQSFLFTAQDSRGYSTELTVTAPTVPYVLLTLHGTCYRPDPVGSTAVLAVQGSFYNGSFGVEDNSLSLTATVNGSSYTMQPQLTEDGYTASVELTGLDYTSAYTVTVTAQDKIQTVERDFSLQRGIPVFDWGRQDFAFHVPVTAPSINGVRNMALKAWPIGAVYMSCDHTSPADLIGGKWERLEGIGIDLNLWRRLQGADLLGTALLGSMTLGEEA